MVCQGGKNDVLTAVAQRRMWILDGIQANRAGPGETGRQPLPITSARWSAASTLTLTRRVVDDRPAPDLQFPKSAKSLPAGFSGTVGDFVQKQRAGIRLVRNRRRHVPRRASVNCAFTVSKELALEHPFRQTARVHGHQSVSSSCDRSV